MTSSKEKSSYHHGELYSSLITEAHQLLKEGGIEALSLRKLAERVGVSRTAPYHHFKDKNELLCALAADGFKRKQFVVASISSKQRLNPEQSLREFVYSYVENATQEPELYDLMFGRTIWKTGSSNKTLHDIAYPVFQQQVELVKQWQQQGLLDPDENSLRLSQVVWSTLHGITRLVIDGIYRTEDNNQQQIKAMCDCAINQFIIRQ